MRFTSLVVVLFSLVACGEKEKGQRGELTMAMVLPRTGTFSTSYQSFSGAALLAQTWINDAGGLLGNDLVFDEHDEAAGTNGTAPITAVAEDLVARDIQVWIGPQTSDSAIAVGPIAGANKRLLMAPNAAASAFSTIDDDDFAFRGTQLLAGVAIAAAHFSYANGCDTASVLHLNNAVSTDQGNIFANAFADAAGTVLVNHSYSYDTTNPGSFNAQAQLDVVFAGNPDCIFLYGAPTDATVLLSTWNKGDWNGRWVLGAILATTDLVGAVGASKLAGTRAYTAAAADPATRAVINTAYEEVNGFPLADVNAQPTESLLQWTLLAALAIEKAGVNDGALVRDALREVANAPGEPVMGTIDYRRAVDIIRSGGDLDFVGVSSPLELDANGDFVGNVAEREFNAAGSIDTLRTLVPGTDF